MVSLVVFGLVLWVEKKEREMKAEARRLGEELMKLVRARGGSREEVRGIRTGEEVERAWEEEVRKYVRGWLEERVRELYLKVGSKFPLVSEEVRKRVAEACKRLYGEAFRRWGRKEEVWTLEEMKENLQGVREVLMEGELDLEMYGEWLRLKLRTPGGEWLGVEVSQKVR